MPTDLQAVKQQGKNLSNKFNRSAVNDDLSRALNYRRGCVPDVDHTVCPQSLGFLHHTLGCDGAGFVHHLVVSLQLAAEHSLKALSNILSQML